MIKDNNTPFLQRLVQIRKIVQDKPHLLLRSALGTASEQNYRWLLMLPQRKQCAEIGVSGYQDSIFRHSSCEDYRIRFRMQSDFPHVYTIIA